MRLMYVIAFTNLYVSATLDHVHHDFSQWRREVTVGPRVYRDP